jgi:hypothetical protein
LTHDSQAPELPLKFALHDAAWVIFGGGAAIAKDEASQAMLRMRRRFTVVPLHWNRRRPIPNKTLLDDETLRSLQSLEKASTVARSWLVSVEAGGSTISCQQRRA